MRAGRRASEGITPLAPLLPLLGALVIPLVLACAPVVGPEPGGTPTAPERPQTARPRDAVTVRYVDAIYRYEVSVDGTAVARGGPAPTEGTARIRTATYLTLHTLPNTAGARVRVTVDSVALQGTEPRIPPPDRSAPGGAAYEADLLLTGRSERVTPTGLGCPGRSPVEGVMHEVVVPLPSDPRSVRQWEDSVVTVSCRDDMPITTAITHRYTFIGTVHRDGVRLLRIRRESASRIEGSAVRRRSAVGLSGTGSERADLLVDPERGIAVAGERTASSRLALTGADGAVELTQRFTSRLRLLEETDR